VTDRSVRSVRRDSQAATLATTAWLSSRGYEVPLGFRWEVAIAMSVLDGPVPPTFDSAIDTRFHLSISQDEWGFFFCHAGRVSWIRVTDVVAVQDRDEFKLRDFVPPLRDVANLVHRIEERERILFRRQHAAVRTTIKGAEHALRIWVAASL
jgi:hypothetical protein